MFSKGTRDSRTMFHIFFQVVQIGVNQTQNDIIGRKFNWQHRFQTVINQKQNENNQNYFGTDKVQTKNSTLSKGNLTF